MSLNLERITIKAAARPVTHSEKFYTLDERDNNFPKSYQYQI